MGARIELRLGELAVPASLNDTAAARALAQRLPLDLRMCASTVGCCGALPFSLPADPALVHRGWTDGDVNYNPSGDWLAIFFDDERNSLRYGDQLTIGRVEGPLDALRSLDGRLEARVSLAGDPDGTVGDAPRGATENDQATTD